MKKLSIRIMIAVLAVVMVTGCNKKKKELAKNNALDSNDAEDMFSEVFNEVNSTSNDIEDEQFKAKMALKNPNYTSILDLDSSCATWYYHVDTSGSQDFFDSISITFNNCTRNGKVWDGTISWTKNGRWNVVGTKTIVTPSELTIEGNKLEFTKTITTTAAQVQWFPTIDIELSFNIEVAGGKVTMADGRVLTWESSRTYSFVWNTLFTIYFEVTGSASGTNRNGEAFSTTITKPLKWKLLCFHPVQGTFEHVTPEMKVTVDLGSGTCNSEATYSINGKKAKDFTL